MSGVGRDGGDALAILDRLIGFASVSRDGNMALIRHVAALLDEAGIAYTLYPAKEGDRASLFATVGPDGPGGVVLSGHTDVVPIDGQSWSSDPFRLRERQGRLYGRGTADMKGFVVCAIEAMLSAGRRRLRRPLHLALSYDEEIGCVGVRPMLEALARAGLKPDWVLVGEPTGMTVATGHKGKLAARATCSGCAAHSALAPTGLNAIHLACDFVAALRALQEEIAQGGARDAAYDIPYTTLHAGVIAGGTALNIVPERCVVDFEIRNVTADDPGRLMERLSAEAERIGAAGRQRFPASGIRIEVVNAYPGLEGGAHRQVVERAAALSGRPGERKLAFGTEGGLFAEALAVPVVVCGPGSMDQGHKADEYVSRQQIEACRAMLSRLVQDLG